MCGVLGSDSTTSPELYSTTFVVIYIVLVAKKLANVHGVETKAHMVLPVKEALMLTGLKDKWIQKIFF